MPGLVLELQSDLLKTDSRVTNLLRKAFVISKKLGVKDVEQWIDNELNGYNKGDDVPQYRIVYGDIRAHNPYQGWIPVHFGDHKMGEALSKRVVVQPIGELDDLLDAGDGMLSMSYSHEIQNMLMRGSQVQLEVRLIVSKTKIIGILDAVRNALLEWTIDLESKGITGEGMTFTADEKKIATRNIYKITNNIGSMSNSQIQQHSNGSSQNSEIENGMEKLSEAIGSLKNSINHLGLSDGEHKEYKAEIATIESQTLSPRPKTVIISESLKSIRAILEGASGNLVASELLSKLAPIMQIFC